MGVRLAGRSRYSERQSGQLGRQTKSHAQEGHICGGHERGRPCTRGSVGSYALDSVGSGHGVGSAKQAAWAAAATARIVFIWTRAIASIVVICTRGRGESAALDRPGNMGSRVVDARCRLDLGICGRVVGEWRVGGQLQQLAGLERGRVRNLGLASAAAENESAGTIHDKGAPRVGKVITHHTQHTTHTTQHTTHNTRLINV